MTSCKVQAGSFLTLNKSSAWGRGLQVNLDPGNDRLAVRQGFEYTLESEMTLEELFGGVTVTDFAVGPCHILYILGVEVRDEVEVPGIWVYDSYQKTVEPLACTGALLSKPTSITYAPGTLYIADAAARQRVIALAEVNWQIRWAVDAAGAPSTQGLGTDKTFTPVDLAVSAEGDLYALDGENRAVLKFDVAGRHAGVFGRAELAGAEPRSLALSPEGYLYVLDPAARRVWKFDTGLNGALVNDDLVKFDELSAAQKLPEKFRPSGFAVDSRGVLYVGERRSVTSTEEDDRFIRRFDEDGNYLGEAGEFRGSALTLALDTEDWIYVYGEEEDERKMSVLTPTLRYTRLAGQSLVKGRYFSRSLDSAEEGTEWHKFVLDADIPGNTQVLVSYRAADDKLVTIDGKTTNLDTYIEEAAGRDEAGRAADAEALDADALGWSKPAVNAGDALILDGVGRYLWLRIDLIGGEEKAPSIGSLRLDFPRDTYLRYLPAVYQEDEQSRDFLERFLSLFETFFSGTEGAISHLARYFDVDSSQASGDFLRWLATWLSISEDKSWSEGQLRELVRRAPELYRKRGTRDGLEAMIEIFTGERPLVVEHFQTEGCARSAAETRAAEGGQRVQSLEEILRSLYGTDPYCFCVLLKPYRTEEKGGRKVVRRLSEEERKAVRRIVDAEKPAHTCAGLLALQPWIHLDMHTYLGVNTYLSRPSARLDLNAAIPRDTVLDGLEEAGQLERRSRLNLDITLT
ncbi:MAG TPA: phage tail protein [Pyrinomonadaceae bacterium]